MGQWSGYKKKRRKVLQFLVGEQNRVKHEAFFDEDFERVKQYQEAIDFINTLEFSHKVYRNCPMCNSTIMQLTEMPVEVVNAQRHRDYIKYHKTLKLYMCRDCGFYAVELL